MNSKNSEGAAPEFFSPQVTDVRRFYLDLNPPRETPLVVVCGGREHCAPDYRIQRTTLPYNAIEFVARGRGAVRLRGRHYDLQPGKVFCYAPGIAQDITTDPSEPMVKYFVNFTGTRVRALWRLGQLIPGQAAQVFLPNEVQAMFDELIRNGQRGTRHSAAICTKLLECLMLKVAESLAPREGAESQAFITYQNCRRHIEANFVRLRTVEEAVKECHVNAAYACRLFNRFDHQSPYQYLLRLKMNKAAEELYKSNALIKQIAEQVGFCDQFHFSRVFKNVFGVSPAAFRRLL